MQSSAQNHYSQEHGHSRSAWSKASLPGGVSVAAGPGGDVASLGARARTESARSSDEGTAAEPPLVNRGQLFTPTLNEQRQERQQRRAEKIRFRQGLRRFAKRKSVQLCGSRVCSSSGVGVRVAETDSGRRAGFAGLSTCGNLWLCPVCSAKISARRAEELGTVLKNARTAGYDLALVTLTVRHTAEDSLREVWAAVSRGWHRVTSGKPWLTDKERFEIPGWVKAVEVTHSPRHGWHVHVHSVVAYRGSPGDATALGQRMFERWQSGLKATKGHKGFTALPGYGVDVQVADGRSLGNLGMYLSKLGADLGGLSREVTQGTHKVARSKNRTPFQIGRDLVASAEKHDRKIWDEWQEAAPGHRQMSWAKGFRERFGLDAEEVSDEQIAAEELGTDDDTVCVLPSPEWKKIKHRSWELLNIAENHGVDGLLRWLTRQGVGWEPAPLRERRQGAYGASKR